MPTDTVNFLDPTVLAKLEGLQLRAARIVEGYVSGLHRSPYQGFSVEFAEHREYVPGDDLRYVDWKVFGKTDKVYLKQYEEETNLICYLVLDTSESMQYQSEMAAMSKLEYAQCAAASLAYLVIHQVDSVGLVTFDDAVRQLVRPCLLYTSTNDQAWDVDHLLGAASGRLIATGRQLWMIDPVTGETQFVWPDNKAVDITSSGRGCIAGDEIFWPTERAIYVFDSRTGQQSRNPIALDKLGGVGGANLVPCGDGLLVATKSELILLGDKPPAEEEPEPKPTTLSQR